ncbi:hypothetical protein T492DRAFT_1112261 [Pavlovales sp. CCMP2436]|nr:hypothetical protein T492DRAFT_1112261 [Pavlovales sp. CCMP2436]
MARVLFFFFSFHFTQSSIEMEYISLFYSYLSSGSLYHRCPRKPAQLLPFPPPLCCVRFVCLVQLICVIESVFFVDNK